MKAFRFFAVALACAVMAVACKQPEPVIETSLKVSPETATFNANSPADASITVTANKAWTASSSASWLTLSATSGEGDARITLKATENVGPAGEAAEARTAEVTFASEDKTAVVKVSQKAETIVFVVDKTEAQVPADGASVVISVEYNTPYEVTIPAEATWITKGATKATTTASVTLSVAANDVTAAREATVTLTPASGSAKTVKITQAAAEIVFDPSKIETAADLAEFAKSANTFASDFKATVVADLDMAGFEAQIDTLLCTLDFAGHSLKNWAVTKPLILVNKGTVSAAVIDATSSIAIPKEGDFGALVAINAGTVENCINNAPASLEATVEKTTRFGTLVGYSTGIVKGCKNTASVSIKTAKPLEAKSIYGGVVGSFDAQEGVKAIVDCENSGDVTYVSSAENRDVCIGGVVGATSAHGCRSKSSDPAPTTAARLAASPNVGTVASCKNTGAVSIEWAKTASGSYTNIGGIIGYLEGRIENCINTGAVSMIAPLDPATCSTRPAIGGVSACVWYGAKDCENQGKVTVRGSYSAGTNGYARAGAYYQPTFGGVFGQVGYAEAEATDLTMENCKNSGELDFVANQKTAGGTRAGVGGVVGYTTASLIDCKNTGKCNFSLSHNVTYMGGITGFGFCKAITRCINEGEIIIDGRSAELSADATNKFSLQNLAAGIVAYVSGGAEMTDCQNSGNISVTGFINGAAFSYLGGIMGQYANGGLKMTNCKNIGKLDTQCAYAVCFGGLAGAFNGQMTGCESKGDMSAPNAIATTVAKESEIGGLAGYSNANYSSNVVECTITTAGADTFCGGLVGGIGANEEAKSYKGNTINATINGAATKGYIAGRFRYEVSETNPLTTIYYKDNVLGGNVADLPVCGNANGHSFVEGEPVTPEPPVDEPGTSSSIEVADFATLASVISNAEIMGKDTTIVLTADIDCGGYTLTANGLDFKGTFDGQGHSIKNLTNATFSVFGQNYGTIKNLVIDSSCTATVNGNANSAFLVTTNLGTISGITILANLTGEVTTTKTTRHTGFICAINRRLIENCVNRGNATWTSAAATAQIRYAPIAGSNAETTGVEPPVVKNCENYGSITYNQTTGENTGDKYFSGIVAVQDSNDQSSIEGCVNYGAISFVTGGASIPRLYPGGVVGLLKGGIIKNCKNYGTISNDSTSETALVGGLVSTIKAGTKTANSVVTSLEGCESICEVNAANATHAGLVLGGLSTATDVVNLGTEAAPVSVGGTLCGTAASEDNYKAMFAGTSVESSLTNAENTTHVFYAKYKASK